jgi:hypothetical protein
LLLWIGLIGFFVSGAAYVTTKINDGLGIRLITVARRLGMLAGLIIVLMFAAGLFGFRVTPKKILDSLENGIRAVVPGGTSKLSRPYGS